MKHCLAVLVCIIAASCSAEQAYNGAQSMERSRCAKGPASEYQDCLARNEMSYREYEKLRDEEEKE